MQNGKLGYETQNEIKFSSNEWDVIATIKKWMSKMKENSGSNRLKSYHQRYFIL